MFKKIFILFTLSLSNSLAQTTIGDLSFGPKEEAKGQVIDEVIAIVGDEVITAKEIQKNHPNQPKNKALESSITRKLLLQAAKKENINVANIPFNLMLKELAQATKTTPEQIKQSQQRKEIKENLAILRLQRAIVSDLVEISDQEINDLLEQQIKTQETQIKLQDLLLKPSSNHAVSEGQIKQMLSLLKQRSDQSIADQYDNVVINQLSWINMADIPPRFFKVLIDLPINEYSQPIIDKDGAHFLKILEKKGETINNQLSSKQTNVSHILIRPSDSANQLINQLYQRLQNGENFKELAQQYSEDDASAINGGNLGWVSTGQLVPEFTAVMDKTAKGEISQPIQTQFGFHLLKVLDRKEKKFSDKKALERFVKEKIYARKAAIEWRIWIDKLRQEGYVRILSK